ncbi:hypothetical protein [Sphingobacterium faecium]|uniref:hypothetical protein n=1 Tax=Sphingobacterium faecium TaxID=34087 RepID=UPI00247AA8CB|nr:hypothetical protein [Sphingobacterium faecium]WGQ14517.1 hypothetical protein QG727_21145 [Sphingobacterium faecium]
MDKINIFLVDYFNQVNGGLTTYFDNLKQSLSEDERINLNLILVKSSPSVNEIKEITDNRVKKYIFPYDIALTPSEINHDLQLIDFLENLLKPLANIIFHFNWINHAPFAYQLKKKINCSTIVSIPKNQTA